jgi:hypothetical protein
MEFECDQLEDVLMYFKQFLQGAGYTIDGVLDIIPNEEYYGIPEGQADVDMDGRC